STSFIATSMETWSRASSGSTIRWPTLRAEPSFQIPRSLFRAGLCHRGMDRVILSLNFSRPSVPAPRFCGKDIRVMLNRPFRPGRACLLVVLGASLSMANDHGEIAPVPTPSGWRQHDVHRPKPPVVEPGEGPVGVAAP